MKRCSQYFPNCLETCRKRVVVIDASKLFYGKTVYSSNCFKKNFFKIAQRGGAVKAVPLEAENYVVTWIEGGTVYPTDYIGQKNSMALGGEILKLLAGCTPTETSP